MFGKTAIRNTALPLILLGSAVLQGCAATGANTSTQSASTASGSVNGTEQADRIRSLESELSARQTRISALETQLRSSATASSSVGGLGSTSDLFPPNAEAGQCYARVLFPEKFETSTERVLAKEAGERIEVIPASFENGTERVLVKEATSRLEVIPATYKTVTEQVLVKPASKQVVAVPAEYRTETERVLDKPAYTVWKKGGASSFGAAAVSETTNATGELMCLVEVPATYNTVSREVLVTPAATREIMVPAEYRTVERRVVDTPASTREVDIPAEYDTVAVTKLSRPASERRIEIPAEYRNVTTRKKVSDARLEWQEVLCEVNSTPSNVRALQNALKEEGYNPGNIDGNLGPSTIRAVNRYAQSAGIPQGANYVPVEVLKRLDLDI